MSDESHLIVICPCCEARLTLDGATGSVIAHEAKQKPLASFEEMQRDLAKQQTSRQQLFEQELSSQKDRERLLEEKFKEAMRRADSERDKPFPNPLDRK